MRQVFRLLAVVAGLIGAACTGDSTSGPVDSSTLILELSTPHTDDGAVLFELRGPTIDTVVAVNASLLLFTRRAGDGTMVGALVGPVANGAIAIVRVSNPGAASAYSARIVEVADRQNTLRGELTGYALRVIR